MSNNARQNFDCPPLMSDGRLITDYRPSCELHYYDKFNHGIKTSHDLRAFYQNNAVKMMANDRAILTAKNTCVSCAPNFFHPDPNGNDVYWTMYRKYLGY